MRLQFLRQKALDMLWGDKGRNFDYYAKQGDMWLDEYFLSKDAANYSFDSGIIVNDFKLKIGGPETDIENAKIVYEALRGKINQLQATDLRLWAYLTHNECWEYMKVRWPIDENEGLSRIGNRYFFDRAPYVRNGIARLYWIPFLTYDDTNSNPYEYMEYALNSQDIQLHVLERQIGRARDSVLGNLQALKERDDELSRTDIRLFLKMINQLGGITLLDSMSRLESLDISRKYVDYICNLPRIENGKDVIMKELTTGITVKYAVKDDKLFLTNKAIKTSPAKVTGTKQGYSIEVAGKKMKIMSIL